MTNIREDVSNRSKGSGKKEREDILKDGKISHERSKEYASYIMEAVVTNTPYKIGGNVLNNGYIDNLPSDACVEVPCYIDGTGVHPVKCGQASYTAGSYEFHPSVSPQLLAIEAAVTKDRQKTLSGSHDGPAHRCRAEHQRHPGNV